MEIKIRKEEDKDIDDEFLIIRLSDRGVGVVGLAQYASEFVMSSV